MRDAGAPGAVPGGAAIDLGPVRDWRSLAAIGISVCLWASAFVGIRAAGRTISPGALALGRLLLGSLLLGVLLWSGRPARPSRRDLGLLFITGLLWFGLYNVALNAAERAVDAGTAAMIINVAPVLVMMLATVVLRERLTRTLVVGGAVAFAGVLLIGLATSTGSASLSGVLLCLVATLGCAIGVVAQKPVLARLPAVQVTWMCCVIGALCCLPYAPSLVRDVRAAPLVDVAWMVYLGVFPTTVAFTTWAYALARSTAGRLAATTYLVAPITIAMSWLILDEIPGAAAVLGGALCLIGVFVARRTPSVPARPA